MSRVERSDTVTVETANRVADIDERAWTRFAPHSVYSSRAFLLSMETDPLMEARYLVARVHGEVVGVLPAYLWTGDRPAPFHDVLELVRGRLGYPDERDSDWLPNLLLSNRGGYHGEILNAGGDPSTRCAIVRELVAAGSDLARACDARSSTWFHLPAAATAEIRAATRARTITVFSAAGLSLRVGFSSFDEYLAMFRSNRRVKIRRERRVFARAGYDVGLESLFDCYAEAGPLLAQLQRRYGHEDDDERRIAYLGRRAETLRDAALVFTCRLGGRLVGFSLYYVYDGVLYAGATGFDYGRLRGAYEYFNLGYYLPIEHAIDTAARLLDFGPGSYEAKVERGASLTPLWSLVLPPHELADADARAEAADDSARAWAAQFEHLPWAGVDDELWTAGKKPEHSG